ncbi:MAG: glycoside hydrolase, partial [Planctomycetota bacterium]
MQIHPESGGPHAVPIDAQRCLGFNDIPMSEFWAWSWRHRIGDANRFFVKQPASAAHVYGRKYVAAEGFTTIGPHWQETLWDNLKPSFDKACCEGFNMLFWHAFVCSPKECGMPGIQYFAGTHLNPNVTWWDKSKPFFDYINRCQFMLQQGLFVADAVYYYGDHVPNFAQHKRTDPAGILPGYDYDVITEEALLTRASVRDGRIVLPDGMSYRILVLPPRDRISLAALRKVAELVRNGAVVVGPRPVAGEGLQDDDEEIESLAAELWDTGRVRTEPAREILAELGVPPDFTYTGASEEADIDYIHRRTAEADIYFVADRGKQPQRLRCAFRVLGKAPELWNPVTGERTFATAYRQTSTHTEVELEFPPCGSWFVVFRESADRHPPAANARPPRIVDVQPIEGPWQVTFDPNWGGPGTVVFDKLVDWTTRPEPGIRFYSGTAVYQATFHVDAETLEGRRLWLDLG